MKSYTRRLMLAMVLLAVFALGALWFGTARGYAQPGGRPAECGYFTGACFVPFGNNLYTPVFNNGITAGLSSLANGAVENKAQFINFMNNMLGGTAQEHTGAAFLIDLMLPGNSRNRNPGIANFSAAINQANITLRFDTNQSYLGWNSGYMNLYHPASNTFTLFADDDAFFPEVNSAPALDVYQNGNLVFIIKQVCGNPLGNLAGVTVVSWNLNDTASVAPATALSGSNTPITFNFSVINAGPSAATYNENVNFYWPTAGTFRRTVQSAAHNNQGTGNGNAVHITDNENIPATAAIGDEYCETLTYSDASGPGTGNGSHQVCTTVIPPPCVGNATPIPALNPWQASVTSAVQLSFPQDVSGTQSIPWTVTGPNGFSANGTGSAAQGITTYTIPAITPPAAGPYQFSWSPTASSSTCHVTINVVNLPYFSVFGADVDAGGGFQPACGTTGGKLESWYDNQAAVAGANTLFAAIADGQITGFASAQPRAGPNPAPTGLTFANSGGGAITTDATSPSLGGNYGGSHCFYTPTAPAGTPTTPAAGTMVGVGQLSGGAETFTAANVMVNGGTVPIGKNVAMFANGNVYIKADVTYAGSAGGWSIQPGNTTNIPSFVLEAAGNIYIDPGVSQLDGIYIAHGKIYTCANGFAPVPAASIYDTCNAEQLTVNGSFSASQINLERSIGTLSNATAGENLTSGVKSCVNTAIKEPVCAAEIFNFSPEIYLSNPAVNQPNNGAPTYDAITSLPPVL